MEEFQLKNEYVQSTLAEYLAVGSNLDMVNELNWDKSFQVEDLRRLKLFSGFIRKVKHNYLWEEFPRFRKLIQFFKIELKLFAEYHQNYSSFLNEISTRSEKIEMFCKFSTDYLLKLNDSSSNLLLDLLKHEWIIWNLKKLNFDSRESKLKPCLMSIPKLHPNCIVHRYKYNPTNPAFLDLTTFIVPESTSEVNYLYKVGSEKSDLEILNLDHTSFLLLNAINGKLTLAEIHSQLFGENNEISTQYIIDFYNSTNSEGFTFTELYY